MVSKTVIVVLAVVLVLSITLGILMNAGTTGTTGAQIKQGTGQTGGTVSFTVKSTLPVTEGANVGFNVK